VLAQGSLEQWEQFDSRRPAVGVKQSPRPRPRDSGGAAFLCASAVPHLKS
jgi:hypothetical protein